MSFFLMIRVFLALILKPVFLPFSSLRSRLRSSISRAMLPRSSSLRVSLVYSLIAFTEPLMKLGGPTKLFVLFVPFLFDRRLHVAQFRVTLKLAARVVGDFIDGEVLRQSAFVFSVVFNLFYVFCIWFFVFLHVCC